jgi:hypothetical protein
VRLSRAIRTAVNECEYLGVRAQGYIRIPTSGLPGIMVGSDAYMTEPETLATASEARDWAQVVCTLARGILA